jgi:hypothetical protein
MADCELKEWMMKLTWFYNICYELDISQINEDEMICLLIASVSAQGGETQWLKDRSFSYVALGYC